MGEIVETDTSYTPHPFTWKGRKQLLDQLYDHRSSKAIATLLHFYRLTFVSFVIVKSPRISPRITRALLLLDASMVPGGKMASPVYSLPSVEMKRTKRSALAKRGKRRRDGENHILKSSTPDNTVFIPRGWDRRCSL